METNIEADNSLKLPTRKTSCAAAIVTSDIVAKPYPQGPGCHQAKQPMSMHLCDLWPTGDFCQRCLLLMFTDWSRHWADHSRSDDFTRTSTTRCAPHLSYRHSAIAFHKAGNGNAMLHHQKPGRVLTSLKQWFIMEISRPNGKYNLFHNTKHLSMIYGSFFNNIINSVFSWDTNYYKVFAAFQIAKESHKEGT